MKRLCYIALACFLVFSPEYRLNAAEEQTVTPTLERVAMFKNGYIIVQQIIDIPAPGTYCWENVPVAVHGTFFTESDLDVEIRTTHREIEIPPAFSAPGTNALQRIKKPTMIFSAKPLSGKSAGKIRMIYLTQGATWAPSYRVKLLDNKTLSLEQSVVLLNEWMPIRDAEIALVSGFPQIETAGILSPLHPDQTLRQFLAQLVSPGSGLAMDSKGMMSQMAGNARSRDENLRESPSSFDIAATPVEGPDIHYNSIGKRTLEVGDSLVLTTGRGQTTYERVQTCDLSTSALGQWLQLRTNASGSSIRVDDPDVFEVIKFLNPLPFPMTTAPVAVTDSLRFLGQSKTNWVNPNQPASVNITKVMNVSVSYIDELDLSRKPEEMPATPNNIPPMAGPFGDSADTPLWSVRRYPAYNSNVYRLCPVHGTIEITNRRNEPIMLHLTSAMVGVIDLDKKLIADCDVPPKTQTLIPSNREYAPNNVARLYWEIPLQPGEKKTITIKSSRWLFGQ